MDITLPTDSPLNIAVTEMERACRMAKGLHLLKARLQALHYRMLSAERISAPAATACEWAEELSAIMHAGGLPKAVEQTLVAVMEQLKAV
jgi:hypothetical protein